MQAMGGNRGGDRLRLASFLLLSTVLHLLLPMSLGVLPRSLPDSGRGLESAEAVASFRVSANLRSSRNPEADPAASPNPEASRIAVDSPKLAIKMEGVAEAARSALPVTADAPMEKPGANTTDRVAASVRYFPSGVLDVKPALVAVPEGLADRLAAGGVLDVKFYVSASGDVDQLEILMLREGGEPEVIETLKSLGRAFTPGQLGGAAVAVQMLIRLSVEPDSAQSRVSGQASDWRTQGRFQLVPAR